MMQADEGAISQRLGAVITEILRVTPGAEVIISTQPEGYGVHIPELGQFHIVKKTLGERLTA